MHMSRAQRGAGRCESQVLVLARPGDFLLSALYLSSPTRTALSRGGTHLPNPKWVERGGKEKPKVSDTKPLFKYLLGHCVVPYLVHKPPGAGLDSGVHNLGFRVPAAVHRGP